MEPIRVICTEELAARWRETVARDGLEVRAAGEPLAGIITHAGREGSLRFSPAGAGRYQASLVGLGYGWLRKRVETILLASGAALHLPEAEPAESLLYRCEPSLLERLPELWRRPGLAVELRSRGEFVRGSLARSRHRIEVESGPAYDPESHRPAVFVELRPRYRFWLGAALRAMAEDAGAALVERGAVPVLLFGDRPTESGRR